MTCNFIVNFLLLSKEPEKYPMMQVEGSSANLYCFQTWHSFCIFQTDANEEEPKKLNSIAPTHHHVKKIVN